MAIANQKQSMIASGGIAIAKEVDTWKWNLKYYLYDYMPEKVHLTT